MTEMELHTSKLKAKETGTSDMMLSGVLAAGLSSVLVCGVPVANAGLVLTKEYSDSTHHYTVIIEKSALLNKHPRAITERGRKMLELRKKAVNNGMKLFTQNELLAEMQERRGEMG